MVTTPGECWTFANIRQLGPWLLYPVGGGQGADTVPQLQISKIFPVKPVMLFHCQVRSAKYP